MLEFTRIPGALEAVASHTWVPVEDPRDELAPNSPVETALDLAYARLAAAERLISAARDLLDRLRTDGAAGED